MGGALKPPSPKPASLDRLRCRWQRSISASMADFQADTAVSGEGGKYRATLSRDWEVWGPFGGYVAAIALRAIGRETELRRPASIAVHFLSVAEFGEVELEVTNLRRGKRAHALAARMSQRGAPVLTATAWVVDAGMRGLEHTDAVMPHVPPPSELASYSELAANYTEWYPVWHGAIDGKPVDWSSDAEPAAPQWYAWLRLAGTAPSGDPFLDAARSLLWLDMMMWNAACRPHTPWPVSHLAPSLDVTAMFHGNGAGEEWLLCDSHAPVASENLVGCTGRVWTADGRLVASGTSMLFCRPNPLAQG